MTDPDATAIALSAAEVQSLVNMAAGDRLPVALWAEFGFGNPDDTAGRPRSLDPDDPYWAVAARRLRERVATLDAEPTAREDGAKPTPYALWTQANGDRDEYLRLMVEHGHLIAGKRPPGEDIFGHAAWRTPSIPTLDVDTLLYVRESIAGIIAVDRGHPFIDALPLIDEIIRLVFAALPEPEPAAREDGPELPRHHHQSFAARDACESCVAAMTRARAVANVEEAKRTIREDWPDWLRSNRDAVHQQPTRHVHSEAFDCDETCPAHPDFAHPEAACQRCGRPNPVWSAPNDLWNAVMGDESGIVCPSCFAAQAEDQGDVTTGWRFEPVGSNDRTERLTRIIDDYRAAGAMPEPPDRAFAERYEP